MQLSARILVSPKFIAGGQGPVHYCGNPIISAGRLKRDGAFGQTQTSNAAGGIILVSGSALRDSNCHDDGESDQTSEFERPFFHSHVSLLKLERSRLGLRRVLPLGPNGGLVRNADV